VKVFVLQNRLCRWLFLLVFTLSFALSLALPAAHALPAEVHVSLFQANNNLSKLIIDGPHSTDSSGTSSGGHCEFFIDKNALVSKERQVVVRHFSGRCVVRGTGGPLLLSDGNKQRRYRGRFVITIERGRLHVVNVVDSKSYITSVVGSESLPDFPLEALKAQAVLASSVLARHSGSGALGDTTEIQAYLGSEYERPLAKQATDAVFGQELKNKNGFTAAVYYHSTCAGGTSDARQMFSGKAQKGVAVNQIKCDYCQASPFFKTHSVTIPVAQVKAKLGFLPIAVESEDWQKRPMQIKVLKADGRSAQISGYEVWLKIGQKLGWDTAPGMRYNFENSKKNFILHSSGAGHGSGLCQWGAATMARKEKNYRLILKYYFPDCTCTAAQ